MKAVYIIAGVVGLGALWYLTKNAIGTPVASAPPKPTVPSAPGWTTHATYEAFGKPFAASKPATSTAPSTPPKNPFAPGSTGRLAYWGN